jgi:hypothetical protein
MIDSVQCTHHDSWRAIDVPATHCGRKGLPSPILMHILVSTRVPTALIPHESHVDTNVA